MEYYEKNMETMSKIWYIVSKMWVYCEKNLGYDTFLYDWSINSILEISKNMSLQEQKWVK